MKKTLQCVDNWIVDEITMCRAGVSYDIEFLEGEDAGYCTVYSDKGPVWATWMDIDGHFDSNDKTRF